jgi:hypothetical protein
MVINAQTKALIIGVGAYEDEAIGDLPTAVKDAEEFAATLERLGIADEIKLLTNPRCFEMVDEIEAWIKSGREEDRMISYSPLKEFAVEARKM